MSKEKARPSAGLLSFRGRQPAETPTGRMRNLVEIDVRNRRTQRCREGSPTARCRSRWPGSRSPSRSSRYRRPNRELPRDRGAAVLGVGADRALVLLAADPADDAAPRAARLPRCWRALLRLSDGGAAVRLRRASTTCRSSGSRCPAAARELLIGLVGLVLVEVIPMVVIGAPRVPDLRLAPDRRPGQRRGDHRLHDPAAARRDERARARGDPLVAAARVAERGRQRTRHRDAAPAAARPGRGAPARAARRPRRRRAASRTAPPSCGSPPSAGRMRTTSSASRVPRAGTRSGLVLDTGPERARGLGAGRARRSTTTSTAASRPARASGFRSSSATGRSG